MSKPLPKIEVTQCVVLPIPQHITFGVFRQGFMHVMIEGLPFKVDIIEARHGTHKWRGVSVQDARSLFKDDWSRMQIENYLMATYFRNLDPKRYNEHLLSGVKTKKQDSNQSARIKPDSY